MLDESFHLTPLDVRRTDFPAALRGYDKARVDEFRDRVANELERLTRVNQELEAKAKGFHEQLRAFRERDKALNEALVSAQQLRAETREQAEREAQLIIREARAEGVRQDAARGCAPPGRRDRVARTRPPRVPGAVAGDGVETTGGARRDPRLDGRNLGRWLRWCSGDQGAGGSNTGSRGTATGAAGDTREAASNSPSHFPPPPSAPIAPPVNGADADRAPSLTPAWLKAVPAE